MPVLSGQQQPGGGGGGGGFQDGPRQDWQFILGPAAGGWVTPLAQATGRTITWRLTDAHDASFTVNATAGLDAGIVPLATDLHVLFAGQPVFRGRIGNSSDQLQDGSHLATFAATSYRGLLNRRQLYATSRLVWTTTDVATIAWGLLTQTQTLPGGNLGIVQGLGFPTVGMTASKTVQPGDLIGEKIDDLAYVDIGGFDWDIQPSDQTQHTLDLWPAGHGQDRGVVLQYGDGITGSNWQRDVDTSVFADAIRMTGGTPSTGTGTGPSPVEVTTADIATRPEGRWDASFQTDELDPSLLGARAALQLSGAGLLVPSYTIPLQPGKWGGPHHIWVGDTIHVSLSSGRFTGSLETLRVLELAADVGQDATTVTLTAGAPRPDLRRELQRLARELRRSRKNRSSGRNLRPGYRFLAP
jgi:hypothetical protein